MYFIIEKANISLFVCNSLSVFIFTLSLFIRIIINLDNLLNEILGKNSPVAIHVPLAE